MVEDELDDMLPVKARKPSKPKGYPAEERSLIPVKPADKEPVKSRKSKVREPTPDLVEESSRESIQVESDVDNTPDTSIEEESSIEEKPVKKARGRAQKSVSATPQPQPKPRARSVSAQPSATKVKATPTTASTGVRGRKPKLSAVPETQVDEISIVEEEDEVDDIELAPRPRQGSILPQSVTRKVSEVCLQLSWLTLATDKEGPYQGIANAGRQEFCTVQRTCRETFQRYDLEVSD